MSLEDIGFTTAEEWCVWLAEQQRIALEVYGIKPAQLIADQRREQGISRDYKGREILELLQNAADAAKKAGQRGRIRVELSRQGLIVANTGLGFTTGGVRSLQTADLSPKRDKNSQLIGSKGLGFRSVLNWSRQPIIISGTLHITFNSRYALSLVDQLRQQYPAVRSELAKIKGEGPGLPPLLPFPVDLNIAGQRKFMEDAPIFKRCQCLRDEGYATIIGMPFDHDQSYDSALKQLQQLRSEFLLFSDAIESLSISVSAESVENNWEKQWVSTIISEGVVDLIEQDGNRAEKLSQRWQLFSQTGEIPAELLRDNDDPDSYHLVVAVQEEGLPEPANLYSFFPTSIPLPLHLLCHASLELEQNRKHLQEGEANEFVLQKLAIFVADIVEQQAEESEDVYRALDLIDPVALVQDYQADIKSLQWSLIDAIKDRGVLPTLSGELLSANKVQSFPRGITELAWLPVSIFPHIALARNSSDKLLFDRLGVETLDGEQFVSLLRASTDLTLEQRAAITLGIINQSLGADYCFKGLLLDTQGNPLSEEDSVYLPGGSLRKGLLFPKWAKVKILYDPLWALLRGNKVRDSAKALSVFGVHEYALGTLISGLVSSANNIAVEEFDEKQVRSELLQLLYALFRLYSTDEERPEFPKRSTAYLPNQKNEWVNASQLYFSAGYGLSGNIVSRLYKAVPDKLVASPSAFSNILNEEEFLQSFLIWLDVAEWPREITSKSIDSTFFDYAKQKLSYPTFFAGGTTHHHFESPDKLPNNCRFESVISLDAIDEILSSDSNAILAWLGNDPRAISWSRFSKDIGTLSFYPPNTYKARIYQGDLPSYISWKIKYSPWLISNERELLAPSDCMVNDAAVSGLFPRPLLPTKEQMEELGLTSVLLKHAWLHSGVRAGIEDLDSEEIYALMLELPEKDPAGNLAKKLYSWLIKTIDFDEGNEGHNYIAFSEGGLIYAKQDDQQGYFPVADAYHVDVEGFPQELLRSLPVASLQKKRGGSKVQRLFRVNVLDKEAVNEQVIHYQAAACTAQANQHFQTAKKYIEIFRHSQFSKAPGQAVFERLQLVVCDQVQSQITFNEAMIGNSLPPWTYSIQGDRLFVCCNPINAEEPYNPLLANTIGDAIASIFLLTDGDSFSKIYQCDESNRAELLSKMLGDELDEDLDALLQNLIKEAADSVITEPLVAMGPVPEPSPPVTSPVPPSKPTVQPAVVEPEPTLNGWNVPSVIGVEPVEHFPKAPGPRIGVRVSGGGGSSASRNASGTSASPSDGKAGEKLAELFEEQEGRFPLPIGHITGYETIAADILSFRNAEDRAAFKSNEDQSAGLIERVIEAKEKTAGGTVKLTVNEVNTAAEWKEKYYIYRFTPIDVQSAQYQLTALNNPLSQLAAVASSIEISLDTATTSKQYRVFGKVDD